MVVTIRYSHLDIAKEHTTSKPKSPNTHSPKWYSSIKKNAREKQKKNYKRNLNL